MLLLEGQTQGHATLAAYVVAVLRTLAANLAYCKTEQVFQRRGRKLRNAPQPLLDQVDALQE